MTTSGKPRHTAAQASTKPRARRVAFVRDISQVLRIGFVMTSALFSVFFTGSEHCAFVVRLLLFCLPLTNSFCFDQPLARIEAFRLENRRARSNQATTKRVSSILVVGSVSPGFSLPGENWLPRLQT